MKDIKTTLCTACKIYYEDIDYDDCPLCDLKGDDDAWRRTYESTHAALLKSEAEVERLREALRDMVTLVEQVEAFPTIVAQHNGLTNEGLKQLDQARAILYEKDK